MGGPGSGRRWYVGAAESTDEYRQIDVRRWQREGFLAPGRRFDWTWSRRGKVVASIEVASESDRVILAYRLRRDGENWQSMRYPVMLDWTDCHYGGKRAWFRCVAGRCERRVAILYQANVFTCRHCLRLAYPSQRESDLDRATRQVDRIRERLGWPPSILNGRGNKPKGMHWTTFDRLVDEHDRIAESVLIGIRRQLGGLR